MTYSNRMICLCCNVVIYPICFATRIVVKLFQPKVVQWAKFWLDSSIDTLSLWAWEVHYQPPLSLLVGLWDHSNWANLGTTWGWGGIDWAHYLPQRHFFVKVGLNHLYILGRRPHLWWGWPTSIPPIVEPNVEAVGDALENVVSELTVWVTCQLNCPLLTPKGIPPSGAIQGPQLCMSTLWANSRMCAMYG